MMERREFLRIAGYGAAGAALVVMEEDVSAAWNANISAC
jgi:hypothetical protein